MKNKNNVYMNDPESKKAAIKSMINSRLKKLGFHQFDIDFTIDMALGYLADGDTVFLAIHTAIKFAKEDFGNTGPQSA